MDDIGNILLAIGCGLAIFFAVYKFCQKKKKSEGKEHFPTRTMNQYLAEQRKDASVNIGRTIPLIIGGETTARGLASAEGPVNDSAFQSKYVHIGHSRLPEATTKINRHGFNPLSAGIAFHDCLEEGPAFPLGNIPVSSPADDYEGVDAGAKTISLFEGGNTGGGGTERSFGEDSTSTQLQVEDSPTASSPIADNEGSTAVPTNDVEEVSTPETEIETSPVGGSDD